MLTIFYKTDLTFIRNLCTTMGMEREEINTLSNFRLFIKIRDVEGGFSNIPG